MAELTSSFPDFSGSFGDKRIAKKATQVLQKLTLGRSSSLRQITESESEQKSFYRLFNNESFSEEGIEQSIINRCSELCTGRHLLCIQDTTEFNLTRQKGRIKKGSGIGKTTKEGIVGFMLHSSLVIDADTSSALGYSYIRTWDRKEETPDRHIRKYKELPIEQKESYKWVAAAEQSKRLFKDSRMITVLADRESDIYELLAGSSDERVHILVRSSSDRRTEGGIKLQDYLNSLPVMHQYTLEVKGDIRKNIIKRTALMSLKWDKVVIKKPVKCTNKELAGKKELYVVEAKEQGRTNGVYWRLLTTHPVICKEDAIQIIEWYKQRWHIEQIHPLLKTEGFRIESSQLEQGWAIRKLTMLALMATLRILQMMLAYEDDHEQSIEEVFDKGQQQCLQMLNQNLEGQTDKLKNQASPNTLKWATWIIARLGGWKGYETQRKPGPIVLQKGLAKFYQMYEGWSMYQKFSKDVSTP